MLQGRRRTGDIQIESNRIKTASSSDIVQRICDLVCILSFAPGKLPEEPFQSICPVDQV